MVRSGDFLRVPFFLGKNGVSTRGPVNTHSENALAGEVGGAAVFREDVAHAADLSAYSAEFVFEVFVASVEVVDAVEDGLAVGDESGEDQRGGGAEVGAHDCR